MTVFTATGTWYRPHVRRTLGDRLRAAWAAFRANPQPAVTLELVSGGGGGSVHITQVF